MVRPAACAPALGLIAAALLPWIHLPPAAAGGPPEPEFPSTNTLRKVQLTAIECSRDNGTDICATSRKLSDGLLDNPLLSVSCKDDLWDIRQKSVVAPSNTYERRDALSKTAERLLNVCKPTLKPLVTKPAPGTPEKPKGFGFGLK